MSVVKEISNQLDRLPIFLHVLTKNWLIKELAKNNRYQIVFPTKYKYCEPWTHYGDDIVDAQISTSIDIQDETVGFTILPSNNIPDKLSVVPQELEKHPKGTEYWIARLRCNTTIISQLFTTKDEAKNYLIGILKKQLKENDIISGYDIDNPEIVGLTKSEFINNTINILSKHSNLEIHCSCREAIDFSEADYVNIDFFHVKLV